MNRLHSAIFGPPLTMLLLAAPVAIAAGAREWQDRRAFTASSSELRASLKALPTEKRSEVAVLWAEAAYVIDAQGRATLRRRTVYCIPQAARIEHDSGWDVVRVGWAPWYQQRPALRARSLAPDGSFRELDASTITERAAERWDDVFSDARVLEAPLPTLVDGTIVEVESVLRDREPFFAAGSVYREYPLAAPYVQAGRVTVDAALELPLHWKVEGGAPIRESERTEKRQRKLRFEYEQLSLPEKWELGVASEELREPTISFSTARDWASVAKAYATIIEAKLSGAQLGSFLAGATKNASREQAVEAVQARIYQTVRYTGLELGSESIIPVRPDETLRRGYGDCKDQALLMVGALRHLGVAAHVALLRPGWGRDVASGVPGMGLFRHAIVFVPGQPAYWIDPTFKFSRLTDLPDGILDREALVAARDTVGLVKIPATSFSGRGERRTREVFLAPTGKGKVIETTEYFGVAEAEARARHEVRSQKAQQEAFDSYAKSEFLNAKLDRFEVTPAGDLGRPFRLRLEMSESGRAVADATEAVVAVMVSDLFNYLPWGLAQVIEHADGEGNPQDKRTQPYRVHRAVDASLHYQIHLPAGMVVRDPPSKTQERLGPITWSRHVEHPSSNRVDVVVSLKVESAVLTAREYEDVAQRLRKLGEERAWVVYFDQEVAKLLASGSVKSSLGLAQRLVAEESGSPFRREQLALALLAAGLGEAAAREAEQATRLEPRSSSAFQLMGWCYQHDVIGRRFGAGYLRAKAIEAYRKSIELDPKNYISQGDLAILLEHDAQGRRYGPGVDLTEPIAIYRTLRAERVLPGLRNNLPVALLRSGKAEEALELLPREDLDGLGRELRLVALALERGSATALTEARRSFSLAKDRSVALRAAAMDLLGMQRFAEASELFRASASDAPNAAELLRLAGWIEKASKWQVDPGTPEKNVLEFFNGVMDTDYFEKARERIAPEVRAVLGDSPRALFGAGAAVRTEIRAAARVLNLDPGVLMELGFRAAHYERSGDDGFGYRVTVETQFGKRTSIKMYFIPTPNGLRAVMSAHPVGAIGVVALKAIERGDERSARRWLEWAYEEDKDRSTNSVVRRLWSPADQNAAKSLRAALGLAVEAGANGDLPQRLRQSALDSNSSEQIGVNLALARGAVVRSDFSSVLTAVEELGKQGYVSPEIISLQISALERLKRWDDVKQLGARLRAAGEDKIRIDSLEVMTEFHAGRIAEGLALMEQLGAKDKAGPREFNEASWATLFVPGYEDKALRWAQRAAELTRYQTPNVLNTLAAIYAWQSKPQEAYRLVVQTLDLIPERVPTASDWVVMGRISEDYGLGDEAMRLYQRAIDEDSHLVASTLLSATRLAQLQIQRLKKK